MSTHRNCNTCGTMPYFDIGVGTLFIIDVPVITIVETDHPHVHMGHNSQYYEPNHRKRRRSKFKRSGRSK